MIGTDADAAAAIPTGAFLAYGNRDGLLANMAAEWRTMREEVELEPLEAGIMQVM